MVEVNNSAGKTWLSQRASIINAANACQVTSMCMALAYSGWKLPTGSYKHPADNLLSFIQQDSICKAKWNAIDPQHTIPINEWHDILCLGTNRWIGSPVVKFVTNATINDIIKHLTTGGNCVLSGQFDIGNGKKLNHVVACVGFQRTKHAIVGLIIDDPWGNPLDGYKTQNGDNVLIPYGLFRKQFKPLEQDNKWCHFIEKAV